MTPGSCHFAIGQSPRCMSVAGETQACLDACAVLGWAPTAGWSLLKAIQIDRYGGPDVLVCRDLPVPTPGPGDVLIRLAWSGINFMDIPTRQGKYAASRTYPQVMPTTLGIETLQIVRPSRRPHPAKATRCSVSTDLDLIAIITSQPSALSFHQNNAAYACLSWACTPAMSPMPQCSLNSPPLTVKISHEVKRSSRPVAGTPR